MRAGNPLFMRVCGLPSAEICGHHFFAAGVTFGIMVAGSGAVEPFVGVLKVTSSGFYAVLVQ